MLEFMDEYSNNALFSYFEYAGMDARFGEKAPDEYFNPVLPGFFPDPSICRKGGDFFLVHSSFAYYPGVPIFHSRDLTHWEPLGHVLARPSQLNLDGLRLNAGIFAPDMAYNPRNDTFYMITTCVGGIGNFIVKTKDPFARHWSDPVLLPEVTGIDPSLFFDDDGAAYIVHNDEPEGVPEWAGHRAIWLHSFDTATDTVADTTFGGKRVILDAGIDRGRKPVWIEGPHLYKAGGAYLLMAAEGGTSVDHSEVVLRSDSVRGPYTPYAGNPILTQRDLPEPRGECVTSVGHADLVETPGGEWFAVFLGCRPYEGNFYNTGRETFMLPVTWKDGFPLILERGKPVPARVRKPRLPDAPGAHGTGSGNFRWRDDFSAKQLGPEWSMVRTPRGAPWFSLDGKLVLAPTEQSIYGTGNPAFLGRRQQHTCFEAETEMRFTPKTRNGIAGMVCYQNEANNFVFGKTFASFTSPEGKIEGKIEERLAVTLTRAVFLNNYVQTGTREKKLLASVPVPAGLENAPVRLKVKGDGASYSFFLSFDGGAHWLSVAENVDGRNLSTETAGGFVGATIGPYAGIEKE
jgi:alpha-N-arabinofuranosidase